jgi:hypothetical protein
VATEETIKLDLKGPRDGDSMTDILNLAMLVGAGVSSMVFGLLSALATVKAVFWIMRPRQSGLAAKSEMPAVKTMAAENVQ